MAGASNEGVAIVGMTGRFPGAPDIDAFWRNLRDGVESITFFTDAELRRAGVDSATLGGENYVKAGRVLDGIEEFDADFFGYSHREAALLDPQQRLFLEAAWSALEDAGYAAGSTRGSVAVFAGLALNGYLLNNVMGGHHTAPPLDDLVTLLASDKDFLATRVSYHLDLTGPSFAVQCGCSSSLVAVAQAFHGLSSHQCDMALAGGIALRVPQERGYAHVPEGILSPDGHCRPFDARGEGTSFGSGLGIVVLKRLSDALSDGDRIRAVIRGAAINNDGARKIGYTAPSVERQAEVISLAQALAGVDPETIGYLEAHGTATRLGDPIEVAALVEAFATVADRKRSCALGSLKGNIGHLDAASGIAGLIKTVLALEHRMIPASLNFDVPNPEIDFDLTPFYVNTELREWRSEGVPRRAGVSSFGVGGTNAHVVLEEALPPAASAVSRPWQLLLLSARTAAGLEAMTARLAAHLEANPALPFADVAYTLQVGRKALPHRRALCCADVAEARTLLRSPGASGSTSAVQETGQPAVVFVLPGEGAHVGMGRGLYDAEPTFRERVDHCCGHLRAQLKADLCAVLFPDAGQEEAAARCLLRPVFAEPALFVTEHALACLWKEWGVQPQAMIGHGVGELAAACVAGVFRLEDALQLAALRGRLVDEGRSPRAEAALAAWTAEVDRVRRRAPKVPFASSLTGTWITAAQATDPSYWARQVCGTGPVGALIEALSLEPGQLLLQLGPRSSGSTEASELIREGAGAMVVASLRQPRDARSDLAVLLSALGRLWLGAVPIDWDGFYRRESRRRVSLPTYPFERQRHWIEPATARGAAAVERTERFEDPSRWFYVPSWKRTALGRRTAVQRSDGDRWLLLTDPHGFWDPLARALRDRGCDVVTVRPGLRFDHPGPGLFTIDPGSREDHRRLIAALAGDGVPARIVHLWLATPEALGVQDALSRGFFALCHLVDAIETARRGQGEIEVTVVTTGVQEVTGDDVLPERATVLGACRVLPQERPWVRVRTVDLDDVAGPTAPKRLSSLVAHEITWPDSEPAVAYRGGHRWVPRFEAVELSSPPTPGALREHGVYLITGGLGGIGLTLAGFLAEQVQAKLVLTSRAGLPPREEWEGLLSGGPGVLRSVIGTVLGLEAKGAEVMVARADVADRAAMEQVVAATKRRFGALHGVIHAAGVAGEGLRGSGVRAASAEALEAKVEGTLVLEAVCGDEPDFLVLCSALAVALGGVGQAGYCAANAFLDAFALARQGKSTPRAVAIGWDTWAEVGMAVSAQVPPALAARKEQILKAGLTRAEGVEVFRRILASPHPHVLVSTSPIDRRSVAFARQDAEWHSLAAEAGPETALASVAAPEADGRPVSEIEATVTSMWTQLLGVEHSGRGDSFFEQGGNSLLATQFMGRLLQRYPGADLSLRSFFDSPTIAGLVALIESQRGRETVAPAIYQSGDQRAVERPVRERIGEAAPADRRALIRAYLERETAAAVGDAAVESQGDGDLVRFDQTLIAAHLTWALRRDLELRLYPHEIRESRSLEALARLVEEELSRSWALGSAAPPDPEQASATTTAAEPVRRSNRGSPAAKNASMAFVLSAPRSGSTLLRLMLSAHSALFCPPELFLLDNEGMQAWMRDPFSEFYRDGLVRAFMAVRDLSFPQGRAVVDELVSRDAPVGEVYRMLQQEAGCMLVDKTPTYALSLSTLMRAEELFDSPRYLILVRHPYATIDSFVRNRLDRVRRVQGEPYALGEKYWVQAYRNLAEFAEGLAPDRTHLVRYEDLVRDPGTVMRRACGFLGVGFEETVLDPYGSGHMFGGPGDPNLFQRGAIDESLGEVWRRIELPRPVGEACTRLARSFEYELP